MNINSCDFVFVFSFGDIETDDLFFWSSYYYNYYYFIAFIVSFVFILSIILCERLCIVWLSSIPKNDYRLIKPRYLTSLSNYGFGVNTIFRKSSRIFYDTQGDIGSEKQSVEAKSKLI